MWIVTVLGGFLSVPIQVALVGLLNGVKASFKVKFFKQLIMFHWIGSLNLYNLIVTSWCLTPIHFQNPNVAPHNFKTALCIL